MWSFVGLALAVIGAVVGTLRSRPESQGYYEGQVYGMTALSHRRFAIASIAFAGVFALTAAFPVLPSFLVLAAYVIFFILYLASFARGATGEDE